MSVNTLIQVRRGTSAEWATSTGVLGGGILYQGEIGYETDTRRFKIGDGITHWASGLPYAAVIPSGFLAGSNIDLNLANNGSSLTIGVTGLTSSDISDFDSAVSGIVTSISVSPEEIMDVIGSGLVGASGIGIDYQDSSDQIVVNVTGIESSQINDFDSSVSGLLPITQLTEGTGIGITNAGSNYTISVTGVLASLVTDFDESVEDAVGSDAGTTGFIRNGSGINWTYDDGNNTLTANVTGVSLDGHVHALSDITDVSATAEEVNYLDGSTPGTGVAGKAVVLDNNLNITNLGNVSTTGTLTVGGDLIVNGTTTTVNSTITTIDDPILTLGGDTAPSVDDSKDRGIEFRYFDSSAKIGFFGYDNNTGKFTFIPDATNSSEVFAGNIGEIDAKLDWSNINNVPDPIVGVNLTGDIIGTGNITINNLSGTYNIDVDTALQSGVPVSYLTASGVTFGSTTVNLGESSNRIDHLTAISGVSAASPTTLTFCVIDGGSP